MTYKEYIKLMKTPIDELSKEDKMRRKEEFKKRLEVCKKFLAGMMQGYINEDIRKLIPEDDPMQEALEVLRIRVNEIEGEA
jgi:hypothetical protein